MIPSDLLYDKSTLSILADTLLTLEKECFEYPWSREDVISSLCKDTASLYLLFLDDAVESSATLYSLRYGLTSCADIGTMQTKHVEPPCAYLIGEINVLAPYSEILRIGVLPSFRLRAFATHLLSVFIDKVKTQHAFPLMLEVSSLNRNGISFYNKHKFKRIHCRKNYYQDQSDAIVMQYEL